MKNVFKLFGLIALVAAIGFSMTACKNDDDGGGGVGGTSGKLTITGLSEYNGKYVVATGFRPIDGGFEKKAIDAAKKMETITIEIAEKITGDSVELKVWDTSKVNLATDYKGSETLKITALIYESERVEYGNGNTIVTNGYVKDGDTFAEVTFTNGVGEGAFSSSY